MKTRAAVLDASGASLPYAQSKPLTVTTVELEPPGPGEGADVIAAARAREFAVWGSSDLPALLARHGVTLAPMSRILAPAG